MSNYTKNTNFTAKDNLTSGDPAKVIKGAEFDTEFNALQTAVNSKADSNNSQLTGTTDAQAVETTGDVTVGGNLSVTGNATISGNLTFGDADTDTVSFSADVDSSILPDDNNTYDLGSATKQWRNVYVDGTANIDSLVADTADINGGTIDGVSISGSTASFSGEISANGGIALGDNDKATFGASDDLQIYHDGSHSYVSDQGTGNMLVLADNFEINSANNTANKITAVTGGEVGLFHNNSKKLATTATGVDVTGTVTADGLTVDGDGYFGGTTVDATDYPLRIQNKHTGASAGVGLEFSIDSVNDVIGSTIRSDRTGASYHQSAMTIATRRADGSGLIDALKVDQNGDVRFYEDTGTTAKFVWDASAERLTIDGDENATSLSTAVTGSVLELNGNSAGSAASWFGSVSGGGQYVQSSNSSGTTSYDFLINPYGGNVGIGTSTPSSDLHVASSENTTALKLDNTAASGRAFQIMSHGGGSSLASKLSIYDEDAGTHRFIIDSSGNVGIGTNSPSRLLSLSATTPIFQMTTPNLGAAADTGLEMFLTGDANANFTLRENGYMQFSTGNTERARIDSSGNLLVGTTSQATWDSTVGTSIRANAATTMTASGGNPLYLNRLSNDGDLLTFHRGSTAKVGSIGTVGGAAYFESNGTGFRLEDSNSFGNATLRPATTSGGSNDNAVDLGEQSIRWKDLYLSGGVYLGGTGAVNKLDDYEEGTFTPVARGSTTAGTGTYSQQAGRYTKIGNKVSIEIVLAWSAHTGSGSMQIDGLPFNTNGNRQTFAMTAESLTYTGEVKVLSYFGNDNFLQVFQQNSNSGLSALPMDSTVSYMVITGMYETDS